VLPHQYRKFRLQEATKFQECIFGAHPLSSTNRWRTLRWDKYLIENLKAIENLAIIAISVGVLEFELASSLKSYIVAKEVHFDEVVTRSIKSIEEKQNVESESNSN